jgi:uncharacterized membrane protein YsdA (DUF1294 family)
MKWKLPKTTQRGSFLGRQIIKKKERKKDYKAMWQTILIALKELTAYTLIY